MSAIVPEPSLIGHLRQYWLRLPVVGPLLLLVLPIPLIPSVFIALARGNFVNFLTALTAWLLLLGAAWCVRRGLVHEAQLQRLGWSRSGPLPWKTLGAVAAGLATALCSVFIIGHSVPASIAVGLTTLAGVVLNYRPDRLFLRARAGPLVSRNREVADALEEARRKIDSIDSARAQIRNSELQRRIHRIIGQAMDILATIADDPVTLGRARRFLKVYLDGTQRVIEGYARIHRDQRTGQLEDNFRNVLVTIEDTFGEQQRTLRRKDALDLDVQIEVLAKQLENEGVL